MKKLSLFILFTLLVAVLVACGGSEEETEPVDEPVVNETTQEEAEAPAAEAEPVTLRVLIHQNPPMVEFMEAFNAKFEAAYPNVTIDMSIVEAGDLATVTQTRLTANDVDVIDIFGFANAAQPYMTDVDAPNWQQFIQAGLLMDLTGQPFVDNFDEATITDAGSYDGKVYSINLGRVTYSGMFVNEDLLAANNLTVPTTWDELVAACETVTAAGAQLHDCRRRGWLARLRRLLRFARLPISRSGSPGRGSVDW